jgi:hypothetical protein
MICGSDGKIEKSTILSDKIANSPLATMDERRLMDDRTASHRIRSA